MGVEGIITIRQHSAMIRLTQADQNEKNHLEKQEKITKSRCVHRAHIQIPYFTANHPNVWKINE